MKTPARAVRKRKKLAATKRAIAPARGAKTRVRETPAERAARTQRILATLTERYPNATCALTHRSAFELLVAVILSAQCTDVRVNLVTPALFERYPDAAALADADPGELETLIKSTGFFRNKAKSLREMARAVCDEHGGRIPDEMEALLTLRGVARKTANCILGTWYRKNEGLVVDTHVGRLALRLGLLSTAKNDKDAVKIEQDLMKLFPQSSWTFLAHALIQHGREICTARKPKCAACPLATDCPSAFRVG